MDHPDTYAADPSPEGAMRVPAGVSVIEEAPPPPIQWEGDVQVEIGEI